MDKKAFFEAVGLKRAKVKVPGTKLELELVELSAGQREKIMAAGPDSGIHTLAAMTVAESCPDFDEGDVDALLSSVRPEVILELSERVYDLSGLTSSARASAKKD